VQWCALVCRQLELCQCVHHTKSQQHGPRALAVSWGRRGGSTIGLQAGSSLLR
jgi:hypothetical protein